MTYENFCGMIYGNSGYAILSWIFYIVIIVLAGAGIYWLIKNANKGGRR